MTNLEEAIRERAYHLWAADGQPDGNAEVYWLKAQREILTSSLEGSTETAPVTTGPAKTAKVARSGKRKARAA